MLQGVISGLYIDPLFMNGIVLLLVPFKTAVE